MKVGIDGFSKDESAALGYTLYPYEVELTREPEVSDLVICRDSMPNRSKPQIRVPRGTTPERDFRPTYYGNGIVDLAYDIVTDCSQTFARVMNLRPALTYRLATGMHFRYNVIPSSIRSRFMRRPYADSNLYGHVKIEVARKVLREAFELLGFPIHRKNPPSLVITHDVDTEKGLRRSLCFKEVDDDLGVQSIWFLCSGEYSIPKDTARDLSDGSEIGSHDTRHDGKLARMQRHEELLQRLKESKEKLEGVFEREVRSFRSPLLQFNRKILSALKEAGYRSDFSLPCWEPVYPLAMSGFGVESVQEFEAEGVVEMPLTLFQDHQVLNVLGLSIDEAMKLWIEHAKLIRSLEGNIVLLIHPDYAFSADLEKYKQLIMSLSEVHTAFAVPK